MRTHLVINGVDYTPFMVEGSYKINTVDKYESWLDGNMVEHRIVVSEKVSGSVQILCSELGNWPTVDEYIADLAAATDNYVLTCAVYVPSLGTTKAIDCYYDNENVSHIKSSGGQFTDIFQLKITER